VAVLKTFLDDASQVAVRKFQYRPAAHVQREFFQFCEACPGEFVCQRPWGEAEVATKARGKPFQEAGRLGAAGWFELGANLESPPCGAVEQFAMIGRADEDHVCWEPVDLE
jgi:hypothetical protein